MTLNSFPATDHSGPNGRRPHLVGGDATVDRVSAEQAVEALLEALGADTDEEAVRNTPRRAVEAYALTTFSNDDGYDELAVARDIRFASLCQHHLLPFVGVAHAGYLPAERILGLSKLARVVELKARRLQSQEGLTQHVADWIEEQLQPRGVGVVVEAEHLCMTLRGVQARGAKMLTSALHGLVRDDAGTRQEFLALAGVRK